MNEEKIIDALERANKWWKAEFKQEFKDREIYQQIKRFINERQIIALVGLRRTGKTTILLKIVETFLHTLNKANIVYFSFDEFKDAQLTDIIKSYLRLMNKELTKERFIFLFDEIQKVENWEEQLKRLYDENQNIKFFISGSESLFIRKKSRESLAGRMYEFEIKTLSFNEYLNFRSKKFDNLRLYKEEILIEFSNFLLCNGFPEMIDKDKEIAEKYVHENVIEKIIYKDIPQILPIKDPPVLEQIFKIILDNPGEIISLDDISRELGISRQTVSLYIDYLKKSFLIRKLYNFSKNARKTQRKLKKYYPAIISPAILSNREMFGKIFETVIVNQLNAEFFWREANKDEVDIIKLDPLVAIEVKAGEVKKRDLNPLKRFITKFKPNDAFILSYELEKELDGIKIVPFYKYLLNLASNKA